MSAAKVLTDERFALASPSATVEKLTPEMAEELLSRNTHNRTVKRKNIEKIARAITNGEWKLNGEAIKISTTGTILDGQHRLLAVIETGATIETLIITGLAPDTQETMDTGSQRSAADALKLRGEPNNTTLAAIAKRIIVMNGSGMRAATSNSYVVTTAEIVNLVERVPGLREIARQANSLRSKVGMTGSLAGLLMYLFYEIDRDDAEYFFDRLSSGEMLQSGDPIYELRKQLASIKVERGQKSQTYIAAIAIKAWNKFRDGEKVGLLRFAAGGANPETFPEPR